MRPLNESEIESIFQELKDNISSIHHKALVGLENVKPFQHEAEHLEWRYRLGGYTEGLCAADTLDISVYEKVIATLFGPRPKEQNDRPGRKYKYSVDITTEQNRVFTFDVPSMNPLDAYVQLTKRIAYKTIPEIVSVLVYAGFHSERQPASSPIKTFEKDQLVFVSLTMPKLNRRIGETFMISGNVTEYCGHLKHPAMGRIQFEFSTLIGASEVQRDAAAFSALVTALKAAGVELVYIETSIVERVVDNTST